MDTIPTLETAIEMWDNLTEQDLEPIAFNIATEAAHIQHMAEQEMMERNKIMWDFIVANPEVLPNDKE
jgi:hypothetical protein